MQIIHCVIGCELQVIAHCHLNTNQANAKIILVLRLYLEKGSILYNVLVVYST